MMNIKNTILLLIGLVATSVSFAQETRTYFAVDDLGSPVIATDESGNVVWTESYKPYGERQTSSATALNNDRWFTGAPQNLQTGLTDLGNRQYDPRIGRFLSIDPIGASPSDPFSFSRYDYANNNPYSYLDPDGLSVWTKLFKFAKNGGDLTLTLHGMKQDWDTLRDPSASFGNHLIAGLSLASELLPVSGRDVKEGVGALNGLRKGADDVPKGAGGALTRTFNLNGKQVPLVGGGNPVVGRTLRNGLVEVKTSINGSANDAANLFKSLVGNSAKPLANGKGFRSVLDDGREVIFRPTSSGRSGGIPKIEIRDPSFGTSEKINFIR